MANISENLSTVKQSLIDIKNAIVDKGVTPTGNITTYAEAIDQLCLCGGGESVEGLELCIENVDSSGIFSVTSFNGSATNFPNLQLKINNGEWFSYNFSVGEETQIWISHGNKLYLRGDNPNGFSTSITNSFTINCSFNFNVSGYLTSLISTTDFNTITDIPNYCFFRLFNDTTIIYAKDLITDNIINVGNSSFYSCFEGCTLLRTTPTFNNVVSVGNNGFRDCFDNCNNLVEPPTFDNVVTVGESGFSYSFLACQNLVTAPKFQSLTTINEQGFYGTFRACKALKNAPTFESLTTLLGQEVFNECFQECTSLVTAPNFNNIEVANFNDFGHCFEDCTSLVNPPQFNSIKTAERTSFYYCFSGCTSLKNPPQFPSLEEANDACFGYCFEGCTSLLNTPTFPNLTNVTYSDQLYTFMYCFKGCSKLQVIYTPNITTWDENTFVDWVDGVASTGVIFKSATLEIPTGVNGIPDGWTTIIKN